MEIYVLHEIEFCLHTLTAPAEFRASKFAWIFCSRSTTSGAWQF